MSNLAYQAMIFATAAHSAIGHVRKYSNEPYIVHPEEVVKNINHYTNDQGMIATAWLHDVVEDTQVTMYDLSEIFPPDVVMMVDGMTAFTDKNPGFEGMPREERRSLNNHYLHQCSLEVQAIKCADILANVHGVVEEDERFGKMITSEKMETLKFLDKVPFDDTFSGLWLDCYNIIAENIKFLEDVGWPVTELKDQHLGLYTFMQANGVFSDD